MGRGRREQRQEERQTFGRGGTATRYRMRQKLVAFGDDFWIENEGGQRVFKVDGKMLRASFVPDDPTAPGAMTGVLVGPLKDGVVQAELRVAGSDALVVRQANFQIKKK